MFDRSSETAAARSAELALVYERAKQKGIATGPHSVARKLVAYLMAVDRERRPFGHTD